MARYMINTICLSNHRDDKEELPRNVSSPNPLFFWQLLLPEDLKSSKKSVSVRTNKVFMCDYVSYQQ